MKHAPAKRHPRHANSLVQLVELTQEELPIAVHTLDELEGLTACVSAEASRHVLEWLAERQQETDPPTGHTCSRCQQPAQYRGH